jgi:hypothetical protein
MYKAAKKPIKLMHTIFSYILRFRLEILPGIQQKLMRNKKGVFVPICCKASTFKHLFRCHA